MTAGERFKKWVDGLAEAWKERLKGWMASWLGFGMEVFMDILGKAFAPKLKPLLDSIEEKTTIPPELKLIWDEMKEPTGEVAALFAQSASGALIGGAVGKLVDFLLRPITLGMSYVPGFMILDPPQLLALWRRNFIDESYLDTHLHWLGLGDDDIKQLKSLTEIRLDPASWVTAFRREYEDFAKIEDDLKHQGWDEDRIKALKFTTQAYPALADVIRFYAREAFEPDMIAKYGLDEETPPYEGTLFEKLGVPKEISDLYWISHWEHATFMQVREMLHRGLLTGSKDVPSEPVGYAGWEARDAEGEEEMYQWYRVVEIPPIWRSLLTESLWNVPTRVDVRRWWDMRTITEEEMISIYHRQGYHGKDLENYIRWTKVYTDFPMMMTRFSKGWINEDDIRAWLRGLEIPEDRIQQFIEEKTKPEKPAQVEAEREATATEIMKGVKKGIISESEGIEMLGDLGYDEDTARFKLDVYGAVASGSPETYAEFKDITTKYKLAIGKEAKPMPEELKKSAAEMVRLTREVASLKEALETEERTLVDVEVLPEAATKKRDELRVTLHRAEAELNRVKTEYDGLVAEWRHGE